MVIVHCCCEVYNAVTDTTLPRIGATNTFAFTATELSCMDLLGLLTSYAHKIWIEANSIKYFLSYELASLSIRWYTNIAHFKYKCLDDALLMSCYLFSDVANRPWGMFLPMSCSKCGCIKPWLDRKLKSNSSIIAHCVYPGCTVTETWIRLEGAKVFSKDLGLGRWYVVKQLL